MAIPTEITSLLHYRRFRHRHSTRKNLDTMLHAFLMVVSGKRTNPGGPHKIDNETLDKIFSEVTSMFDSIFESGYIADDLLTAYDSIQENKRQKFHNDLDHSRNSVNLNKDEKLEEEKKFMETYNKLYPYAGV
jgi:hypothetical protein